MLKELLEKSEVGNRTEEHLNGEAEPDVETVQIDQGGLLQDMRGTLADLYSQGLQINTPQTWTTTTASSMGLSNQIGQSIRNGMVEYLWNR